MYVRRQAIRCEGGRALNLCQFLLDKEIMLRIELPVAPPSRAALRITRAPASRQSSPAATQRNELIPAAVEDAPQPYIQGIELLMHQVSSKEPWPLMQQNKRTVIKAYTPMSTRAQMGSPIDPSTKKPYWSEFTPCSPGKPRASSRTPKWVQIIELVVSCTLKLCKH